MIVIKIKQLETRIANMIAAGEVVERPASIVKELVENSIDAQASVITIEIEEFGMSLIRITDDGIGMSQADLKMAFLRHATSKIFSEADLHNINTLGFRGEAIPAIASVSKMKIASRLKNKTGHEVLYEVGHFKSQGSATMNHGTIVEVNNLFYNTPARFKYIKSERAENLAITEVCERLAIANPQIRFELINDGKIIFKTLGQNDPFSIVSSVYGHQMSNNLTTFKVEQQKIKIEFILLSHQNTRNHKRDISIYINNRYVQNYLLREAVIKGFAGQIMVGRYPIAIIKIVMDESLVDVNIHPQKLEVKMVNEYFLSDLIERSIKSKLYQKSHQIPKDNKILFKETEQKFENYIQETFDLSYIEKTEEQTDHPKLPYLEYIGVLGGTYLLFQNNQGLFLMDQHAAAERIRYEYYYEKLASLDNTVKQLLFPYQLLLSNKELVLIKTFIDKFVKLGFEFNENIELIATPSWLRDDEFNDAISYLLEQFELDKEINFAEYRDHLAKDISCKGAIKANKHLSREEVNHLVKDLSQSKFPYTCPHGRPTIVQVTYYEIERLFKRIV